MKKVVWYISKYASPLKYGFNSRHFHFAKCFNAEGYKTYVISSDSNHLADFPDFPKTYFTESVDGVDTLWIKTRKYAERSGLSRILSWVDFERKLLCVPKEHLPKPDTIIVSSLSLLSVVSGMFFSRKYSARFILEIRDIWPQTLLDIGTYSPFNPLIFALGILEKVAYKKADVIVGTMPNLREHVKEVLGTDEKVYCIPQGIDLDMYRDSLEVSDDVFDEHLPKDKFIVGYAGSIGKSNALETLISCAKRLQSNQRIYFALMGEGDSLTEFKEQTKGFKNIVFIPKMNKKYVSAFLSRCSILYDSVKHVRLYDFGLSRNKWIDYMFAGKPIIASYSGFPSMLNESDCGTFVPSEDVLALEQALLSYSNFSEDVLNEIGKKGYDWLLEYRTFDKLTKKYVELL